MVTRDQVEQLERDWKKKLSITQSTSNQATRDAEDTAAEEFFRAEKEWLMCRKQKTIEFKYRIRKAEWLYASICAWEDSTKEEISGLVQDAIGLEIMIEDRGRA